MILATDSISLANRADLSELKAVRLSGERAYAMAGKKPSDIDLVEVHDCFTIAEIMAYEDLGFCEKGQGGKYIEERRPYVDGGGVAVNVDGGLKAKGHPIGSTGISQSVEIVKQLRGECGERPHGGATAGIARDTVTEVVDFLQGEFPEVLDREVQDGEMIVCSKGLHLYNYVWELAEILRGKTIEEFRAGK